jgi:hypothetical protein
MSIKEKKKREVSRVERFELTSRIIVCRAANIVGYRGEAYCCLQLMSRPWWGQEFTTKQMEFPKSFLLGFKRCRIVGHANIEVKNL